MITKKNLYTILYILNTPNRFAYWLLMNIMFLGAFRGFKNVIKICIYFFPIYIVYNSVIIYNPDLEGQLRSSICYNVCLTDPLIKYECDLRYYNKAIKDWEENVKHTPQFHTWIQQL
jgi:hypothetical protein